MVPRENQQLIQTLKLPVGRDGFFNEIHPKLRPVETVVDGVTHRRRVPGAEELSGSGHLGPRRGGAERRRSSSRGAAQLDPQVATVDAAACTWCGTCADACPFGAIEQVALDGKTVATVAAASCKGCGGCVPVCPEDAIDLQGYTDAQIRAIIDGLAAEVLA